MKETEEGFREALDALTLAVVDDRLRNWARRDGAFHSLRTRSGTAETPDPFAVRYWEIVGEPWTPKELTSLGPFDGTGEQLRHLGIATAADLAAGTSTALKRQWLACRVGVLPETVDRWRCLAMLGVSLGPEPPWGDTGLELLLAVGVTSQDDLVARLATPDSRDAFRKALDGQRHERGQRGLTDGEFCSLPGCPS
jgi:hypothetical protein